MATTSEVKSGLDNIAADIAKADAMVGDAIQRATDAKAILDALTTKYADLIATIDGYTPTGAFETLAKDERAKLTTEFQALAARADSIIGA